MGIIDLLSRLFAVKQLVKLWPEMAKDLISVFLGMKPFSSQFLYIFRLLNFFFSSDYYAILMSNSFTLVHFCTLMQPLKLVFFLICAQNNWYNDLSQLMSDNKDSNPSFHEEQLPAIAAHSSFPFLFFHPSTGTSQVKTLTQKKQKNGKNNSNLSLLMLYFWSNWSLQACRGSRTGLNFFFQVLFSLLPK